MVEELQTWLKDRGIRTETTVAHTPQQNGVSERLFGKILPMVRSQLVDSNLPLSLWVEVAKTSAYQLQRRSSQANPGGATPWELFFGEKPDVSHMHPVGEVAFILGLPSRHSLRAGKIRPVNVKGRMVGYSQQSKAWRFLILEGDHRGLIKESRDVKWTGSSVLTGDDGRAVGAVGGNTLEQVQRAFPQPRYHLSTLDSDDDDDDDGNGGGGDSPSDDGADDDGGDDGGGIGGGDSSGHSRGDNPGGSPRGSPMFSPGNSPVGGGSGCSSGGSPSGGSSDGGGSGSTGGGDSGQQQTPAVRRTSRTHRAPDKYSPGAFIALSSISTQRKFEPRNSREARECPDAANWIMAEAKETEQMVTQKVMEPVDELPEGFIALNCRYVYKIKYDANGNLVQYKARLVVLGYQQQYGLDYYETFAPTGSMTALRVLLALSAGKELSRRQLDIKGAFLNAELEEEIYIQLPAECGGGLYRLRKALYGLKQAPRVWYEKLRATLQKLGFRASTADPGVFIRVASNGEILIVHVDDLLVFGSSADVVDRAVAEIGAIFEITITTGADFFIGMEIAQQGNQLWLSQRRYTEVILDRFSMADSNPCATPAEIQRLRKDDGELLDKTGQSLYMEMVGSLMYLMVGTRPDLAQAVGALARHMSAPTKVHMTAARRVFHYLAGTRTLGLCYSGQPEPEVIGYADADYAGDLDTRRSTSGGLFLINKGAVYWKSKLQPCVVLSTMEAEYMACGEAAKEALWLMKLLPDLGVLVDTLTVLNDNNAAITMLNNPFVGGEGERAKHIDVKFHFVREFIHDFKVLEFKHIATRDMAADCLTKPVTAEILRRCRDLMGLREVPL